MATSQISRAIPTARILSFNLQGKSILLPSVVMSPEPASAKRNTISNPYARQYLQKLAKESVLAHVSALGRASYLESYKNDLCAYALRLQQATQSLSRPATKQWILANPAPVMYTPETQEIRDQA
jgi:hypothetical protein